MSPLSSRRAETLGYSNFKVFQSGLPSWKKNKRLVLSEPGYVMGLKKKDIAHVLVDLRDDAVASGGHIPGAIAISPGELAGAKAMFPKQKSAPIILYSPSGVDVAAFKTVRGWGYKNVSALNGGLAAWRAVEGTLQQNALAKNISYEPKPLPGTVSARDFKKLAASGDAVLIDVRDPDEVAYGAIPGALNIPLGDLAERSAELPKGKTVIAFCTTGIRAEMAYDMLKQAGFKQARYLGSVMQISADGTYEITEN